MYDAKDSIDKSMAQAAIRDSMRKLDTPVPAGQYIARIVRAQDFTVRDFQSSDSGVHFDFEIMGGEFDGYTIARYLYLNPGCTSEKKRQQSETELKSICLASGVKQPQDITDFNNIPMIVNVGVNGGRNTILGYSRSDATMVPNTPESGTPDNGRKFKLTRIGELETHPPDWLLRGMLERDTFALIFGDPETGKSFLALDWAARIATGTPWRNHEVKPAPVVYLAGEGRNGVGRRRDAWEQFHGVSLADAPLYTGPSVALSDAGQFGQLIEAVSLDMNGEPPALIVLDTLARHFGGGNENSTEDMSIFVDACDILRRRFPGCAVLVVHHAGHGDKNRSRGSSALKAALDAEYRVTKPEEGKLVLEATKMKDAEKPPSVAMDLVTVDLPGLLDEYGNPVTSAALDVLDADTSAIVAKAKATKGGNGRLGKWQRVGLETAKRLITTSDDMQASVKDWHAECEAAGMPQGTRYDVLTKLQERGAISVDGKAIMQA